MRYALDNLSAPIDVLMVVVQEVKSAAAVAMKDLASHEKQQVGLEERLKHTAGKMKKLKKSAQDVGNLVFSDR